MKWRNSPAAERSPRGVCSNYSTLELFESWKNSTVKFFYSLNPRDWPGDRRTSSKPVDFLNVLRLHPGTFNSYSDKQIPIY